MGSLETLKNMSTVHFSNHVKEAIALNQKHLAQYSLQLKSLNDDEGLRLVQKVFKRLLRSEKLTLLFSWYYDWRCPVAMGHSFARIASNQISQANCEFHFYNFNLNDMINDIKQSIKKKDLTSLQVLLADQIVKLKDPFQNCMLRHILESMQRAVWVYTRCEIPLTEKKVYWQYLKGHILMFKAAHDLDRLAFPLQKKGIPVLANELPTISMIPDRSDHEN